MRKIFITALLLCSAMAAFGQNKIKNPELAKVIDDLKVEDQKPYERAKSGEITSLQAEKDFQEITVKNLVQLKLIVKKYGYPSHTLVGESSSHNFWLMVQHSDSDLKFQKKLLKLMLKEVKRNNASAHDYAYLVDRVRINSGKPQLYGSQIVVKDPQKGYELKPVFQPQKINQRRKQMGLSPVEEYLEKANQLHFQLNKGKLVRQISK